MHQFKSLHHLEGEENVVGGEISSQTFLKYNLEFIVNKFASFNSQNYTKVFTKTQSNDVLFYIKMTLIMIQINKYILTLLSLFTSARINQLKGVRKLYNQSNTKTIHPIRHDHFNYTTNQT